MCGGEWVVWVAEKSSDDDQMATYVSFFLRIAIPPKFPPAQTARSFTSMKESDGEFDDDDIRAAIDASIRAQIAPTLFTPPFSVHSPTHAIK